MREITANIPHTHTYIYIVWFVHSAGSQLIETKKLQGLYFKVNLIIHTEKFCFY